MRNQMAIFAFVTALACSAAAANWQTPAEAMQMAAMQAGPETQTDSVLTTVAQPDFFQVTADDVAQAVAAQMKAQGFKQEVTATLTPAMGVLYTANHPLKLAIQGLQVDTQSHLWQAQAYMINQGKTEAVKPVSGRYEALVRVPVLSRSLRAGDVIEEADITHKTVPERQLRKDTITEAMYLLGQSPTRGVSANRPIRTAEISQPTVIKKGELVEMNYTTPYMSIRTSGEALEDGAQGALIRVKNTKTEKSINARVIAGGKVEVNNDSTL